MDGNVPGRKGLHLDENKIDKILQVMEKEKCNWRRDDEMIMVATLCYFDPQDYPVPYEDKP